MKWPIVFAIFALLCDNGYSQSPHLQWQRCLGGRVLDVVNSVVSDANGGCLVLGWSCSNDGDLQEVVKHGNNGNSECWLIKLNSSGEIEWQKCFGSNANDEGVLIIPTDDSGYALIGTTTLGTGSTLSDGDITNAHSGAKGTKDIWVVKLNSIAEIEWQKCFGGSQAEVPASIIQTKDKGFAFIGTTWSTDGDVSGNHGSADIWFVKLTAKGDIEWEQCFGDTNHNVGSSIAQTIDGGYAIGGKSSSIPTFPPDLTDSTADAILLKIDSVGVIQWQRILSGSKSDNTTSIVTTTDGDIIAGGFTRSTDRDFFSEATLTGKVWIKKFNLSGDLKWSRLYNGGGISLIPTTDNGFAFIGSNDLPPNDNRGSDFWVAKLDSLGYMDWQEVYGGLGNDFGYGITQTSDGGYALAGVTYSNYDGGDLSGFHGTSFYDGWVVKIGYTNSIEQSGKVWYHQRVFPNPATSILNIASIEAASPYKIIDIFGRTVMRGMVLDRATLTLDVSSFTAGVYFIFVDDIRDGHPVDIGKVMIFGK